MCNKLKLECTLLFCNGKQGRMMSQIIVVDYAKNPFTFINYFVVFCVCFCLQDLMRAHSQFKETLGEADKEYNAIVQIATEVKQISQQYGHEAAHSNPYTGLQIDVSDFPPFCIVFVNGVHCPSPQLFIQCFIDGSIPHALIFKAQTYSALANQHARSMMFEMLQACWLANAGR